MSATSAKARRCISALTFCLLAACNRNSIEAVNLANEGDKAKDVNPDEAASKFDQALKLDPDNHRIAWKLALAYAKKEDWPKVVETCVKAEQASEKAFKKKSFANYYFEHGYALEQIALKSGSAGSGNWTDAKGPLTTAIQIDPHYAQAYEELAEVMLRLDDEQGALENYTKAINTKPDELQYYPPLADLYIRLNFIDQAEQVLKEGLGFAKEGDKHLFAMHGYLGQVYESKNNIPGAITEYDAARKACGQCLDHREAFFNLGAAYAAATPPRKNEAIQELTKFSKLACKGGASNKKFEDQCNQAQQLANRMGGTL